MNIAKLAIKRPTLITAIIVIMLVVGGIFYARMPVNMFPDVNFPYIIVTTVYPGAGPEEVETLISKKLEEQVGSISGLKNVSSISQDGVSMVIGEFTLETDPKYAEQQVKDKIALIKDQLPDDAKDSIVSRVDPADMPVVIMGLKANGLSPNELYDLADNRIRNLMEQVPNISSVMVFGGTKREIHVDLDRNKLKEYETNVTGVANHIGATSQNIPIGKVHKSEKDLAFRSVGEFRSLDQIKDAIVSFYGSDVPVTVKQVGTVTDSVQEEESLGYYDDMEHGPQRSLILIAFKQSGANSVEVSDNLQKQIIKVNKILTTAKGQPVVSMVYDGARPIRNNLKDVKTTIFEGILLAILVVFLFLGNLRSTFITVIALPNSLIGAFIFMGLSGFSINMLSLMALSLAVGLLIDDAIVVRENIFRHIELGEEPIVAAEKGTNEVMMAVIATTLTVIAVFLPVGFLQGMIGQFFKEFGLTIVFAMAISLFDALTTAPMLSAYMITKAHVASAEIRKGFWGSILAIIYWPAEAFGRFYKKIEAAYQKVMSLTLRHKMLTLIFSAVIFAGSLLLVKGIPITFMPDNENGEFLVKLEAAPGTSLQQMDKYSLQAEDILRQNKGIGSVMEIVGDLNGGASGTAESNITQMFVKMVPYNERKVTTSKMKEIVRHKLQPMEKYVKVSVNDMSMVGSGDNYPFILLLTGEDLDALGKASDIVMPKINSIKGLVDVDTNYKPGKPEFQVKMDPVKMQRVGVQSGVAGQELRAMVEGVNPAKFRENGLEYDVRVRLQDDQRDLSKSYDQVYVPNVNQQLVKLDNIAEPVNTTGPSKIFRRNRDRYIQINANLAKGGAIGDITKEATKMLQNTKLPEGVSYEFIGASEDLMDMFRNMVIAAGLSIIFIFLILASLYESMIVPFTIMLALPLAIVGGLLALFVTGQSINMFTMIGFIMLLGLVTKNSILLVDLTLRLMRGGMAENEAIIKAGLTRLRPILMTTCALIAGMLPLALALSESGKFRQSMGIAIIGGLLSSTLLTLVVIPAIFGYMESFRLWARKLTGRPPKREIDKEA